jgi:chemotaxis protein methyltransferase CheR
MRQKNWRERFAMADGISSAMLTQFSDFIAGHFGLHFPPARHADLQRGVHAAAGEFGYDDDAACVRWLMSAPLTMLQIEVLAGNLTVGETYFFREKKSFDVLEQKILPELIRSRRDGERRLRFWSAACCTGEEAYSLAILLHRLLPDLHGWNVTILATDVSPRFLHKAAQGVFGEWSFRETPTWMRDRYFTKVGAKQYEVIPQIRRMVTFEYLNLAQDIYPSLVNDTNAMDVIFCRNVLMYFAQEQAKRVVGSLHHCLVEGGWLALSATETSPIIAPEFVPVHLEGAILYRRGAPEPVAEPLPISLPVGRSSQERRAQAVRAPAADTRRVMQMAHALANEGRLEAALVCADEVVAAEKVDPRAHYLRALILLEQGVLLDAAKELRRAISLDHGFVLAHFALGNLARNAGRMREAARHLEHALRQLRDRRQDEILPESDGLTAGRLAEIIEATLAEELMA